MLTLDVLEDRGSGTVTAAGAHLVQVVVSGPNIIYERPKCLEDVCAHGEGDWHLEKKVPNLPGVRRNLEAGHDGGGFVFWCLVAKLLKNRNKLCCIRRSSRETRCRACNDLQRRN
jgi:hypothetical protein